MAKIIHAVEDISNLDKLSYFLAGTIDQGKSFDWQKALGEKWEDYDVILLNPRRPDWDEDFGSEEVIKQVKWELEALAKADVVLMNILGDSESPISIAEAYRFGPENKMFVACPEEFYRYDNIKAVCEYDKVPHFQTWDELIEFMENQMEGMIEAWEASR